MIATTIACLIVGATVFFSAGFVTGALWASLPFDQGEAPEEARRG